MEIKVNDYVRTDKGNISKIKWISQHITTLNETKAGIFHLENGEIVQMHYGDIIKSNPNIGKLLKVGDFIDGMRIVGIEDTTIYTLGGWFIDVEDVEDLVTSIVTKEMFEQMEYKID